MVILLPSQVFMKQIRSILTFTLALFLSACSISLAEDISPPPGAQQQFVPAEESVQVSGPNYPLVPPNPENGAANYAEKCAPCHGVLGQGDGSQAAQLPYPATPIGTLEVALQAAPQDWYAIVTNGNLERFMPPFASLSDTERWDVVAYVYSLSMSPEELALGQEVFLDNCAECHGESGNGTGPQTASLSISLPDFTNQAFQASNATASFFQVVTEGREGEMHAFSELLTEQERWAVSSYIRSLGFASPTQPVTAEAAVQEPSELEESETIVEADVPEGPDEVEQTGSGVITGRIINGSGGELPEDLLITLHTFEGMQIVYSDTTTPQADGTYLFQNVELLPGRTYLVTVDYGQATYISPMASADQQTDALTLDVTIFDTTTDTSQLSVERLHIFFEFTQEDFVQVVQLFIFSNKGNQTIIPYQEGGPIVDFPLPEGAVNLQFQDGVLGERYLKTPTGFADTIAIRPGMGEYQVLFAFELPYKRKLDLVQPLSLPVDAAIVMLPEDGVKVRSEMLKDDGTRAVQGGTYRLYSGEMLPAGSSLELSLSGSLGSGFSLASDSTTSLMIGLGSFGLVMIAAGVWLFLRNQKQAGDFEDDSEEVEEEYTEDDVESLIDAIIALDDLYSAGELPEEAYRKRRSELKSRLKEISA
jgi:mono/diheme cytochrome c family protein